MIKSHSIHFTPDDMYALFAAEAARRLCYEEYSPGFDRPTLFDISNDGVHIIFNPNYDDTSNFYAKHPDGHFV